MKKIIFLTIMMMLMTGARAQSCLPDGIIFYTQSQIDNFQTDYPGCTEIEGDVTINGSDITNLNGLNILISIGEDLYIEYNDALTSLTGLENITSIWGGLYIGYNDALTSLTGLENITYIVGSLEIFGNGVLPNLSGLEGLISVWGTLMIGQYYLGGNPLLTSLTGLDNVAYIGESLVIQNNEALTSLTGLDNVSSIGTDLDIGGNKNLTSLAGLENLTFLGADLSVFNNYSLTNLTGLESINVSSITDLYIVGNALLSECEVKSICDYLASPNGTIEIHDNAPGCNSPSEVEEACILGTDQLDGWAFGQLDRLLMDVIPNPGNGIVDFRFSIVDFRRVTLKIYDMKGREVDLVLDERMPAGEHAVRVDISYLPKGVYFVRITDEKRVYVSKLVVQ